MLYATGTEEPSDQCIRLTETELSLSAMGTEPEELRGEVEEEADGDGLSEMRMMLSLHRTCFLSPASLRSLSAINVLL